MATDTNSERSNITPPMRVQFRGTQDSRFVLWCKRIVFVTLLIAVLASVVVVVAGALSSQETGPRLTYIVTRGDLRVTVTEQGTLESSENIEIKNKVRGRNAVLWVVESGAIVNPGDELIRINSNFIEEQIDERTKYAHWSRSGAESSKARLKSQELQVLEYEQGTYVAELMSLEKELVVSKAKLSSAKDILSYSELMLKSGYLSQLEVEEKDFAVSQAELQVGLNRTKLNLLQEYTIREQLATLKGNLASTKATHEANVERAMADASRRDRALEEIQYCVILAERSGLVIHPDAAEWTTGPIEEGTMVYKDQVLLLMPNLSKMQVKLTIHESVVDRIKEGLTARVTIPNKTLSGTVSSVATVTLPASWWNGNAVKYDTMIALPPLKGLIPGMSAEVEILIADYQDVLTIPVAAVIEADEGNFCFVNTILGVKRRSLTLGDSNDIFTIVEQGLEEGDEVVLNPYRYYQPQTTTSTKPDEAANMPTPSSNSK
ncbi:MAG: hypothetical protein COA78_03070 [Blastopirellula sp.]|nr:MAG: hypothetical protein COA78_03070 [Blastopirellula sp.]